MKDWQMRVVDEYAALNASRIALGNALKPPAREKLDPPQVPLMEKQFSAMTHYAMALRARIEAF